jgi:hypothetical protein
MLHSKPMLLAFFTLSLAGVVLSTPDRNRCNDILEKVRSLTSAIEGLCLGSTPSPSSQPALYSPYNWTSVPLTNIGRSNLQHAGTVSYTIPSVIPSSAREVLIHAGVFSGTSNNGPYHDLKIFTQIGTMQYEKYLLVYSWNQAAYNTNSDNMWFPMPKDRLVYLTVPAAHGNNAGVRLFAIGYR